LTSEEAIKYHGRAGKRQFSAVKTSGVPFGSDSRLRLKEGGLGLKKLYALAIVVGTGIFTIRASAQGAGQAPRITISPSSLDIVVKEQEPILWRANIYLDNFKSRNNLRLSARLYTYPALIPFDCGVSHIIHDVQNGAYAVHLYRDMLCRANAPAGEYRLLIAADTLGGEKLHEEYSQRVDILKSDRGIVFGLETIGFEGAQMINPRHWALKWPGTHAVLTLRYYLD
jgi:hypothetical protein